MKDTSTNNAGQQSDLIPGEEVKVIFTDLKTNKSVPMTFIRKTNRHICIEVKLDGEEIANHPDALYLRLAATLIENFRVLARNFNVEIKEDID